MLISPERILVDRCMDLMQALGYTAARSSQLAFSVADGKQQRRLLCLPHL